jgi:hypothetical protein
MKAQLAALLTAAQVLVDGGASLESALVAEDTFTPQEWQLVRAKFSSQRTERFFEVSSAWIQDVDNPPEMYANRPLGVCASGECCVVIPTGDRLCTDYTPGALVNGKRIIRLETHPGVMKGWVALATAEAGVTDWGARKDVGANCLGAGHSLADCATMMSSLDNAWLQPDGSRCIDNLKYDDGCGGCASCSPVSGSQWLDRYVRAGTDVIEKSTTRAVLSDAQMEFFPDPPE